MSDIKISASLDTTQVSAGMAKLRANAKEVGGEISKGLFGRDSSKAFGQGLSGAGVILAGAALATKAIALGFEACNKQLEDFKAGLSGVNTDMALAAQIADGTSKKIGRWVGKGIGALANVANSLFGTSSSEDILKAEIQAEEARKNQLANLQMLKKAQQDLKKEEQDRAEKKKKWQSEPETSKRNSNLRMLEAELAGEDELAKKKREALQIDLERADLQSRYGKDEEARYNALVESLQIKKQIQQLDLAAAKEAAAAEEKRLENAKKAADIQQQINEMRGTVHTSGMLSQGISTAGERAYSTGVDQKQLQKLTEQLKELRDIKAKVTYGYVQK